MSASGPTKFSPRLSAGDKKQVTPAKRFKGDASSSAQAEIEAMLARVGGTATAADASASESSLSRLCSTKADPKDAEEESEPLSASDQKLANQLEAAISAGRVEVTSALGQRF